MPNDPAPAGLVDELEKAWPSGHPRAPRCRCFTCLAAPHRDTIIRALRAEGENERLRSALLEFVRLDDEHGLSVHNVGNELVDALHTARAALGDPHAKA